MPPGLDGSNGGIVNRRIRETGKKSIRYTDRASLLTATCERRLIRVVKEEVSWTEINVPLSCLREFAMRRVRGAFVNEGCNALFRLYRHHESRGVLDADNSKMNWSLWFFIIGSFNCKYIYGQQQRVPPGVSPQHYQQPIQQVHQVPQQMPQQMPQQIPQQIPQQQYQQMPVQHQVPVQQVPMQQQQMHHQVPMQQDHGHEHTQPLLNAAHVVQEKAHIAEHMDVPIDTSKMTEQELQFHYFKMHDADNNNKLDGCELIKSLIHWHDQENKQQVAGEKLFKDAELITLVDPILSMDDTNNDGYIDYPEFIRAQQNAAAATGRQ